MRRRPPVISLPVLLALVLACDAVPVPPSGTAAAAGDGAPLAAPAPPTRPAEASTAAALGAGFLVWESNRSGAWRIWRRSLDGGPARQLSADEPGRHHYAPHISPDGAAVVYLSARDSGRRYPDGGVVGTLELVGPQGGPARRLVDAARTYFENRSVVWRGPDELIFIGEDFATRTLDLASGATRRLAAAAPGELGWLIDASLEHASTNSATFSIYDASKQRVVPRADLGGCQPYFTHDGRWGVWTAGAGGPIRKIELASRQVEDLLAKNDPRLPDGLGYMYFPMPSRDATLLAFAASRGEHDHFTSDYEIFVVETDPETLVPTGAPVRYTDDPGTDRYPDVYRVPLELGRHRGEAPFEVRLAAGDRGSWSWELGDGATAEGPEVRHRYAAPGRFGVAARRGEATLHGLVTVTAPAPPGVVVARVSGDGASIDLDLDEPVRAEGITPALASGRSIAGWRLDDGGRRLRVDLARPLDGADRLVITGLVDLAQEPNAAPPREVAIAAPGWPARRDGLVFVWQTGDSPNLVSEAPGGVDRAIALRAVGTARLDHHWVMAPGDGRFEADGQDAARLAAALQATNELSVELTLGRRAAASPASLVSFADHRQQNFRLELRGDRLVFHLRTGSRGPEAISSVELPAPPVGEAHHVVITYSPAHLRYFVDGELRLEHGADRVRGDFFHWRAVPLSFGGGDASLRLQGVAIYERVLSAEEVAASYQRYRAELAGQPEVPRVRVEGTLLRRTAPPSLEEISPYREALVVFEYEVERVVAGELAPGAPTPERVRVAHWAILDGERQAIAERPTGEAYELVLEPFEANPQLASLFLGQHEAIDPDAPLFHDPTLPD